MLIPRKKEKIKKQQINSGQLLVLEILKILFEKETIDGESESYFTVKADLHLIFETNTWTKIQKSRALVLCQLQMHDFNHVISGSGPDFPFLFKGAMTPDVPLGWDFRQITWSNFLV